MEKRIDRTNEEWRRQLTPQQYHILREKGTEPPFSGKYAVSHEEGIYRCGGCGLELFASEDKFDSGTGWPSFKKPLAAGNVRTSADNSYSLNRTEVICSRCGGHLGHVFMDGPPPTGLRYCINSEALQFSSTEDVKAE